MITNLLRKFILTLCFFHFVIIAPIAHADSSNATVNSDSTSASSGSEASGSLIKKFEENHEITDTKLKAESGSLSVVSARFNLSYYGPPVTDFSLQNQPNPDNVTSPTQVAISGSVGMRYRLDSSSSISLYAGLTDQYPFTDQQTLDVNSPSLSYTNAFKLGAVQIISSPSITWVTTNTFRNVGETSGAGYQIGSIYNIGSSGFAIGGGGGASYYFFDRNYNAKIDKQKVRRINISLEPTIKYNITDRLNVNTSMIYTLFNPRNVSSEYSLYTRRAYERLSVGYAFTRDIYVSPFIQFYPSSMAWRTTTINISSTFSVL